MTNEELISKIKAEIESLKSIEYPCDNSQQATGFFNALDRMTDFLSTLEESNSKDFPTTDEEIKQFLDTHPKVEVPQKYKTPDWIFEKSEKPINPDDAMKELDEKIALVKQRGTWDGVDVDKYMDEVRGREPEKPMQEGLEEEIERCVIEPYYDLNGVAVKGATAYLTVNDVADIARHFAKWQKEQDTRDMFMSDNRHFNKVYELGKNDMKEQMMKEAVEGVVMDFSSNQPRPQVDVLLDAHKYHTGDKVRIIIVKED